MKSSFCLIIVIFLLSSMEIFQHCCHADEAGASYIITADFTILLNNSAQNDLFHLYEEVSENHLDDLAIVRQGMPGCYHYETIQGYEKHPISFTSFSDDWIYYCWNKKNIKQGDGFDDEVFFKDDFEEIFALNQDKASSKFYQKDTQEISRFQKNHLISNSDFSLKSSIVYFNISKSSALNQNIESSETAPTELWIKSSICTALCLGAIFTSGYIHYQHGEYLKTTHFPGDAIHNKLLNEYANSVHNNQLNTVNNCQEEQNNLSQSFSTVIGIIAHFQNNENINNPNKLLTPEIFHKINNYQSLSSSNKYCEITHQCIHELDAAIKGFQNTLEKIQNISLKRKSSLLGTITKKREEIDEAIKNKNYALALHDILIIDKSLKEIDDWIKKLDDGRPQNLDTTSKNQNINDQILSFICENYDRYSDAAVDLRTQLLFNSKLNTNSQEITDACNNLITLYEFLADFYHYMYKEINTEVFLNSYRPEQHAIKNDPASSEVDHYSNEYYQLEKKNHQEYIRLSRNINNQEGCYSKNIIEQLLVAKFLEKIYYEASECYINSNSKEQSNVDDYDKLVLDNCKKYEENILLDPSNTNKRMEALLYLSKGFYNNLLFKKAELIKQISNDRFPQQADSTNKKKNEEAFNTNNGSDINYHNYDNETTNSKVDALLGSIVKILETTLAHFCTIQPVDCLKNYLQSYHKAMITKPNNRLESFYWENAATAWLKAYHARDNDTVKKSFHDSADAFTQAAELIQANNLSSAKIHYEIAKANFMAAQSSLRSRTSHTNRWSSLKKIYQQSLENSQPKDSNNIEESNLLDLSFKKSEDQGSLADFLSFLFCGAY